MVAQRYFAGLVVGLLVGAPLVAETLTPSIVSEKRVDSLDKLIKPHAVLSTRYVQTSFKGSGEAQTKLQFRPEIGFSILDGRYDFLSISRFNKQTHSSTLKQGTCDFYFMPRGFEFSPVTLSGFYQQQIPASVKGEKPVALHILAANATLLKDFNPSLGKVSTMLYAEFDLNLAGKSQTSTYRYRRGSYDVAPANRPLVGEVNTQGNPSEFKGPKQQPDLYSEFDVALSLTPAIAKLFTIGITNYVKSTYEEEVVVLESGETNSSYRQTNFTEQWLAISLQLGDNFKLVNEAILLQDGLFKARKKEGAQRVAYQNLLRLEATIF